MNYNKKYVEAITFHRFFQFFNDFPARHLHKIVCQRKFKTAHHPVHNFINFIPLYISHRGEVYPSRSTNGKLLDRNLTVRNQSNFFWRETTRSIYVIQGNIIFKKNKDLGTFIRNGASSAIQLVLANNFEEDFPRNLVNFVRNVIIFLWNNFVALITSTKTIVQKLYIIRSKNKGHHRKTHLNLKKNIQCS